MALARSAVRTMIMSRRPTRELDSTGGAWPAWQKQLIWPPSSRGSFEDERANYANRRPPLVDRRLAAQLSAPTLARRAARRAAGARRRRRSLSCARKPRDKFEFEFELELDFRRPAGGPSAHFRPLVALELARRRRRWIHLVGHKRRRPRQQMSRGRSCM